MHLKTNKTVFCIAFTVLTQQKCFLRKILNAKKKCLRREAAIQRLNTKCPLHSSHF